MSKGLRLSPVEETQIVPPLAVFTSLFGYLLVTVHDTEFYGSAKNNGGSPQLIQQPQPQSAFSMPFSLNDLVPMSLLLRDVALGLVELAYPESRPAVLGHEYQLAVRWERRPFPSKFKFLNCLFVSRGYQNGAVEAEPSTNTQTWTHLFKKTVELMRQLYTRDTRRQYCPEDHWVRKSIIIPMEKANHLPMRRSRMHYRPFQGLRLLSRAEFGN